jgi:LacI family transcriptional regulator
MFKQNNKLRVLLVIDLSCSYTRNLLKGVSQYAQNNENWDVETTFSFLGKDYHKDLIIDKDTIDGLICFAVDSKMLRKVLESKIPAIVRGPDKPIHGYINFSTDNLMLCKMAYDYFRHLGFQHFAYCGIPQITWSTERADMMRHILSVHGHSLMVYPPRAKIPRKWIDEKPILTKWLQDLPKPIALLAANDFRGKKVLEACWACGIQVPEQIAVLGVDDDECVSPFTRPTLSSIRRSYLKAGYEAAETLNSLMTGQVPEQHVIVVEPQEIIVRQSTNIFAVSDPRIAEALLFIDSNKTKPIAIDDVARHVAVHKRVLYNLFKEHTGQTVHESIRSVRSDHIAKLLLETDLTVSQIASQVGFDDVGHCARFFKKAKGMSPTDYRNYYIPL